MTSSSLEEHDPAPLTLPRFSFRGFNDVLHDALHLQWFKQFLSEKNSEAPLLFWQAVESMKTNCKDGKSRQARAMIITRKYFINIPSPAGECLVSFKVEQFMVSNFILCTNCVPILQLVI